MITIKLSWTDFKAKVSAKSLKMQGEELSDHYRLWAIEAQTTVFSCSFLKTSEDCSDFEANYKAGWNKLVQPLDSDGTNLQRLKVTSAGWSLHYHGLEITTSSLTGVVNKDQNNSDYGFTTIKLYNSSNEEITNPMSVMSCVKTVVDWEPNFDYDIIGGDVYVTTPPNSDIRVSVVGVPDIPAAYGGSKAFMTGFNLKFVPITGIRLDGKTPKSTTYSATNHTNKIRFIFHHNPGISQSVLVMLNIFKA